MCDMYFILLPCIISLHTAHSIGKQPAQRAGNSTCFCFHSPCISRARCVTSTVLLKNSCLIFIVLEENIDKFWEIRAAASLFTVFQLLYQKTCQGWTLVWVSFYANSANCCCFWLVTTLWKLIKIQLKNKCNKSFFAVYELLFSSVKCFDL